MVEENTLNYIGEISIKYNLDNLENKGHIEYQVSSEYRGKGYGDKLVKFGLKIAKELGFVKVILMCHRENIFSKKIIEKNNGKQIKSNYDKKDEKQLVYQIIINNSAYQMWKNFLEKNKTINEYNFKCWQFGTEADYLAELVLKGEKRATTALNYWYEIEGEIPDQVNSYNVILNSKNESICIIRISKVIKKKFKGIDDKDAYIEGEGDKSLDYWRKEHIRFFSEELKEVGLEFNENMEVLFCEFELVFSS